jgi:hypothetical protein
MLNPQNLQLSELRGAKFLGFGVLVKGFFFGFGIWV